MGSIVVGVMVMVVVMLGMLSKEAMATQHVVGGSQGWDESTDFKSWASSQTFKVGDQLVFKYTTGLHSVVELAGESAYKSCDTSTALDSKSGGNDVIKLTKPGTRYFACGTAGHCGQGMKVKITTVAASSTDTPSSSSSSSSSSTTSTEAASSPANRVEVFVAPLLLVLAFRFFARV
ncbi:OLC1v1011818C2 [Oldenlandia corymbosa var. corymbosa]|nr:OLC1v1011818C2 [Oldenlandia corymbosa var. corymbosa]